MPNVEKPENAIEYSVEVGDSTYTVWEFPFNKIKTVAGYDLVGCAGYVFSDHKLIVLDANLSAKNKKWTLDHEVAHIIRWEEGSTIGEPLWDEFETELMVLAKTDPRDFSTMRSEVYTALRLFLSSGRNPRERARMLVNYLRERTNDPTQEGRAKSIKLPEAALQGDWWGRVTD